MDPNFVNTVRLCLQAIPKQHLSLSLSLSLSISLYLPLSRFSFTKIHDSEGTNARGRAVSLTPLYYFLSLHRHLHIGRATTADNSPLHIANGRIRTGSAIR